MNIGYTADYSSWKSFKWKQTMCYLNETGRNVVNLASTTHRSKLKMLILWCHITNSKCVSPFIINVLTKYNAVFDCVNGPLATHSY